MIQYFGLGSESQPEYFLALSLLLARSEHCPILNLVILPLAMIQVRQPRQNKSLVAVIMDLPILP